MSDIALFFTFFVIFVWLIILTVWLIILTCHCISTQQDYDEFHNLVCKKIIEIDKRLEK